MVEQVTIWPSCRSRMRRLHQHLLLEANRSSTPRTSCVPGCRLGANARYQARGAGRLQKRSSVQGVLLRFRFEQQVLVEFEVKGCYWPADGTEILAVHVVCDLVSAFRETPQCDLAGPMRCVEGVVQVAILAYRVSFRPVKTDVVQTTEIFSAR